jgi:hypothetical protein
MVYITDLSPNVLSNMIAFLKYLDFSEGIYKLFFKLNQLLNNHFPIIFAIFQNGATLTISNKHTFFLSFGLDGSLQIDSLDMTSIKACEVYILMKIKEIIIVSVSIEIIRFFPNSIIVKSSFQHSVKLSRFSDDLYTTIH